MKNDRFGALLIISALLAAAVLIALSMHRHYDSRVEQIRAQGLGVVRSLSALPLEMLVPEGNNSSVLQSLFTFYKPDDFAYGAVTTQDGKPLREVVRPGMITPIASIPRDAGSRFGERRLESSQYETPIREFYGQVSAEGQSPMFVRVGYFEPRFVLHAQELTHFAIMALITFMLVPLLHFVLKREMRPLRAACDKLEQAIDGQAMALAAHARQLDLGRLASRMHEYIEQTGGRILHLEQENAKLRTGSSLLEYGNSKLNHVLQSLPNALIVLDPAGSITFASAKIEALLGVGLGAVLSEPVDTWCADDALRSLLLRYRSASLHSTRSDAVEFHPRGAPERRLRASAQPLAMAGNGPVFGTLVVIEDMTREYTSHQAGQDFVAHVSHELKSPLNVISMYCETLQSDGLEDDSLRIEAANVIHDEVERMAGLVNNLLSISKIEVGGLKPHCSRVRIDELLQDVYNNQLSRAQAGQVTLEMSLGRDLDPIEVDKDMFRIAINNLVSNGIKYTDVGGKVTLQARDEDGYLAITVRDTGIGIPPEDQAHVFKKFFRAKGGEGHTRSGHGLGLYLAHEIVQMHHGQLHLESTVGQGSAFSIHLKHSPGKVLNLL